MRSAINRGPYRPRVPGDLTERQREVLALLAKGLTNAEIGDALGVTLDGAKWHVREILARLEVDSREEAADWWRREAAPAARLSRAVRAVVSSGLVKTGLAAGGVAIATVATVAMVLAVRGEDRDDRNPVAVVPDAPAPRLCTAADLAIATDAQDDQGRTRVSVSRTDSECEIGGEYEVRLLDAGRQPLPTDGAILRANAVDLHRIYHGETIWLALTNWCGGDQTLEVAIATDDGSVARTPVDPLPPCTIPAAPTSFRWDYRLGSDLPPPPPTSAPSASATPLPGLAGIPPDQAAALADGTITWEEHEQATADLIACLGTNGVRPDIRPALGKQPTTVGFTVTSLDMSPVARAVYSSCESRYVSAIASTWDAAVREAGPDMATWLEWFGECMASKGVSIPAGGVTLDVYNSWPTQNLGSEEHMRWIECGRESEREFGFERP